MLPGDPRHAADLHGHRPCHDHDSRAGRRSDHAQFARARPRRRAADDGGGLIGLAAHATAAAIGLSALLAASPAAFTALRWAGVAYLLWLGVQGLRARGTAPAVAEAGAGSPLRHVRNGVMSNLLNPKVLLFFVTFLPQFMQGTSPLLLSAIFAGLYALWFTLYNVLVDRVGRLLRKPKVRARVERVTGVLLVGFALRLAVQ